MTNKELNQAIEDQVAIDELMDDTEECPNCGRYLCICSDETLEEMEETRYLDKELDREDFRSDDQRFPSDDEPYYPDA